MAFLILFIFGIIIGSFLNVVTMRYDLLGRILTTKKIGGRSHCPKCLTTLRWYELLPLLSFLIQRRQCRHCDYRLSWQYPLVELLTGVLTAAIPLFLYQRFNIAFTAATGESLVWFYTLCGLWLLVAYTFIVLSLIDLKYTIIPDAANILLALIGIGVIVLKSRFDSAISYHGSFLNNYAVFWSAGSESVWLQSLLSAGVGAILFGGIIALTRGRGMGLGDLKLVIPIGLLVGWPDIVLVLALSFIIGAFISVFLMMLGRKSFKDGVPFGPFLAASVFVVMFFGEAIMNWYFGLL
ncbi:MAG: prepilin peptidase [bacterium]|nr:prepilin peptidase [bacterium]